MRKRLTIKKFIQKAREVHGEKYTYPEDYIGSNTKIKIICPEHGEFLQFPYNHLRGIGCLKCGYNKKRLTTEKFIQKAREVHKNKYTYPENYIGYDTKIKIICPEHGEFLQFPYDHLRGKGCQKCGYDKKRLTTEKFIQKAREVHKNKYTYPEDYIGSNTKIKIICPNHGKFLQTPAHHLKGVGCPRCNSSKLEEFVNSILEKMNLSFNNYSKFEWLGKQNLDIYIESLNLGIESQGVQHFIPIEHFGGEKGFKLTQKRDKTKLSLSKKNGIDIIYFITPKMADFSEIPKDFLKPGGYMGETIIQSEKELYNIIKNRCIEKGVNFVKISEYETVYRNPKFKII